MRGGEGGEGGCVLGFQEEEALGARTTGKKVGSCCISKLICDRQEILMDERLGQRDDKLK